MKQPFSHTLLVPLSFACVTLLVAATGTFPHPARAQTAVAQISVTYQCAPKDEPDNDDDDDDFGDAAIEECRQSLKNLTDLTSEELAAYRKKFADARAVVIRNSLTKAGFTDKALQDKVIDFERVKYDSLDHLFDAYRQLLKFANQRDSTDSQLAAQLIGFQAMKKDEDKREIAALEALEKDLDLTHQPKLDAFLVTKGITSAEGAIASQASTLGDFYIDLFSDF